MNVILSLLLALPAAQSYEVTGLGVPNDNHLTRGRLQVSAVNERGHACGSFSGPLGIRPFFWDGADLVEIVPISSFTGLAHGLNDDDLVVGVTSIGPLFQTVGFLWESGTIDEFQVGGSPSTVAGPVNAAGWVGGRFGTLGASDPFLRAPDGTVHVLDALDVFGAGVTAVNDFGLAVGYSYVGGAFDARACVWEWPSPVPIELPTPGGVGGVSDVDSYGRAVGWGTDAQGWIVPVLWENGVATVLPKLGAGNAAANAISDTGLIVGWSMDPNGVQRACLWENGVVVPLDTLVAPDPRTTMQVAEDVNALGEIVGWGLLGERTRSWKATPILQRPRITGVTPPAAGVTGRCFGLGFQPGATVHVVGSTQAGTTLVPGCGALVVDVGAAELLATTVADPDGRIEVPLHPPAFLAGRTAYLQAVDATHCVASEPVVQDLR